MNVENPPFWERELFKLLDKRITQRQFRAPRGGFSVGAFAAAMGCSSEGLYKFLRSDKISVDGAKKMVLASDGVLTESDLIPFLFR